MGQLDGKRLHYFYNILYPKILKIIELINYFYTVINTITGLKDFHDLLFLLHNPVYLLNRVQTSGFEPIVVFLHTPTSMSITGIYIIMYQKIS